MVSLQKRSNTIKNTSSTGKHKVKNDDKNTGALQPPSVDIVYKRVDSIFQRDSAPSESLELKVILQQGLIEKTHPHLRPPHPLLA